MGKAYLSDPTSRRESLIGGFLLSMFVVAVGVFGYWWQQEGPLDPDATQGEHYFHRGDHKPVTRVMAGETLFVRRSYCLRYSDLSQAVLQRWFENGIVVRLPEIRTRGVAGCHSPSFEIQIPAALEPGRVTYWTRRISSVNPIKDDAQDMPKIELEVVAPGDTMAEQ